MCRLLGVVSAGSNLLTTSLADELGPFSQLSAVHCDGWVLAAWSDSDDLVVRKEPTAASVAPGLLGACGDIRTDAALLHLRKASPGLPVSPANTHPFAAGSIAFAHNGYFPPSDAIDELLASVDAEAVTGQTDSERYFNLVVALMKAHDPVSALVRSAALIAERVQPVAMNALMLTHQALYAFACFDESATPDRPAADSYELRFRVAPGSVKVASSGWDQPSPAWERLVSGTVLEVRRHDLRVSVHRPAQAVLG